MLDIVVSQPRQCSSPYHHQHPWSHLSRSTLLRRSAGTWCCLPTWMVCLSLALVSQTLHSVTSAVTALVLHRLHLGNWWHLTLLQGLASLGTSSNPALPSVLPVSATDIQGRSKLPVLLLSKTVALLNKLTNKCSLCYLFCHQHTCEEDDGPFHLFCNYNCWPAIESLMPPSLEDHINAGYIGTIKRCMGDKAKGIACYTCLVPMKICSGGSLAGGGKCRRTYADIVLPVVAAVIHDRELQSKVFRQLDVEVLDVNDIEPELGTAVTYQGQRVFLAFAIFGAAVDVTM